MEEQAPVSGNTIQHTRYSRVLVWIKKNYSLRRWLTLRKPKLIKRQKARNAEYYDMQRTQDDLYKRSLDNQNFVKLMDIIQSDENIMLAYRNIKRNGGSLTPGTDGRTIEDLEMLSTEELIDYVRKRLRWYVPQPVKRVEIPKGNGKTRPLRHSNHCWQVDTTMLLTSIGTNLRSEIPWPKLWFQTSKKCPKCNGSLL